MQCSACHQEIGPGEKTAEGPSGVVHLKCFKRRTAHPEEITLITLYESIGRLQKRVQRLEHELSNLDHRTMGSMRIGG